MQYKNVISKSYLIPKEHTDKAITDFISELAKGEIRTSTLPFYTIELLKDDWIRMSLYISSDDDFPTLAPKMHFDSYFCVEDMASCCLFENLEEKIPLTHSDLSTFLEKNNLRPITPVYHIIGGDQSIKYIILKIGYYEIDDTNDSVSASK